MIKKYDVVIIGAGAAGMMCAIEAGKRGRKVVLLDHAKKIGEKIYYEPNLRVWHFRRTNIYLHLKQVSNYGSLRGKLCREKLSLLKDIKYYIPSLWLIGLFLTIYFSIIYNFISWQKFSI